MNVSDVLSQSRCFRGVDRRRLKELVEPMEMRRFQRNEPLWREGEHSRFLAFVTEGRIKLVRHRASGKDLILDILGPGRIVDMAATPEDDLTASVIGLAQGAVVLLDRETFLARLCSYGPVALNLAMDLARDRQHLLSRFDEISAGSVEARLASLFVRLAEEEGQEVDKGTKLALPLSRQDLADLVDTTIETAIRIMSRWNRAKIVITERDGFLIPDIDALEDLTE